MKMANNSPHLENLSHNENCAIYWKEHERLFEIYGCYEVTVEGSFTKNIFVPKEEIAEIPKFTKFSKKLNRKKIFEMIQEFKKEQKKDILIFEKIKELSEEKGFWDEIERVIQEDQKFLKVADQYIFLAIEMKLKF
jgi:hypothetical protein